MNTSEAIQVIRALADGVNPVTGEVFPEDSPYQEPQIIRALFLALDTLAKEETKSKRPRPENAGALWDQSEDDELAREFDSGDTVREVAADTRERTALSARVL